MIPLHLSLSGLLSYRDPVEIDFSPIDLACISGPNGAGKSSLLDAMTWALFGQARKRDESLINNHSQTADVSLIFGYEGNVYRVQRVLPRGKTSMLEFQILQDGQEISAANVSSDKVHLIETQEWTSAKAQWKPLTERTMRETQANIENTLRMDYETFVNASFFLQGKADQFTQQRPGDRKRILGSILGLEVWEEYRKRTVERRRAIEEQIAGLDGRLQEIATELDEETGRKLRLEELQGNLGRLSQAREAQEVALENMRRTAAALEEQSRLLDNLTRQLEAGKQRLEEMESRLVERRQERDTYAQVIAREAEIKAGYEAWQKARAELERWDEIVFRFREHEKRLQEPRDEINATRARLEQEQESLCSQQMQVEQERTQLPELGSQFEKTLESAQEAEAQLAKKSELQSELDDARQRRSDARVENPRLKAEMQELKERIDRLETVEGGQAEVACPLCGQPLTASELQNLIDELKVKGRELGDRFRANQALLAEADETTAGLERQIQSLLTVEDDLRELSRKIDRLTHQMKTLDARREEWEQQYAPRLEEVNRALEEETFAPEARSRLKEIEVELQEIGYDAAAHEAARREEQAGRAVQAELIELEKAQSTLAPLEREIAELEVQVGDLREQVEHQKQDTEQAAEALVEAKAHAPDLSKAERELLQMKEQENQQRMEVGAARQKVDVLEDLKARRISIEAERETQARLVGQLKQLERAFSKDGVPALLIEQALPQIEMKANEILDRLSGGSMTVAFVTQSAYKDKRREDRKETLDIAISDSAGTRDYDLYSGGEAFRVNFAIRLALSEVLANRAGARLQTLVIDEGFGSQDAIGRQRLIEAINLVRDDFAKILVITHIEELKDAFPVRIEVEKTARGSVVTVI
jgi:DNA repair protein SbcC/Rad50